jgi:hypothetical protein
MSYQRAVVNCKRCYAQAVERQGESISLSKDLLSGEARAAEFRERAMQALEKEIDIQLTRYQVFINGDKQSYLNELKTARIALTACMNCQYKKAEIAEIFHPSDERI